MNWMIVVAAFAVLAEKCEFFVANYIVILYLTVVVPLKWINYKAEIKHFFGFVESLVVLL